MTRQEFKEKFLETFAADVPAESKRKYNVDSKNGRLWNLFAAKLVPCLEGEKARKEFDKANKTNAQMMEYDSCWMFCFPPYKNPCATPLLPEMFTAHGVDEHLYPETYIFGENFSWCYVTTHTDSCGPYFCYNPNRK